ncbi:RagB/SusD family nutrient uptake outer membrane protein [Parabacteroides sp.]|uniref:RagB/SusD family nutrient uptake outer membrane protein n=1 Tax=Parabacteroides sp. TaxID=1869337 RepID=UPI003080EDE7
MRSLKYYIMGGAMATLIGFNSCELESEVYNSINAGIFPTTESDAEALVTANAYGVFQNNGYAGMFNIATGVLLVSDLMSDYGECTWRGWQPILYNRWVVGNNYNDNHWRWAKFMGKITMTIDRIENMNLSEEVKNQYLAELHCARGWLAFCMYDLYGPIPIADIETLKNPLEEKILPRLSEEDMQDFIVTELKKAAEVLPYSYKKGDPDYGRFTKGLCNMVLLKFYMQTKQWAKAEEVGRELTKPEYGYELVSNYADIFTLANEKHAETIWAVNCLRGTQTHKWHPHVLPNDYPTDPAGVVKWNGFKISWDFFHTFEEGDERLKTIISAYTGTGGKEHSEEIDKKSNGFLLYGAVPFKYEIDKGTTGEDNEIDYIIYRYADALTLLSEAIVRNGNAVTQEAIDLLNRVRTRAGLLAYTMADFKNTRDFLDKLLLERGHELYYEGCRRQDLIRDGSYVEAIKKKCAIAGQTTLVNENYHRIPLPQSVINEGKGQIDQNPGY